MPSGHGFVSIACHRFQSQLPKRPNSQHQHNLRKTLNCLHCLKKEDNKNSFEDFQRGRNNSSGFLANIMERAIVGHDQSWEPHTSFATAALSTSSSSNPQSRQSLTAAMKTNIGQFIDRLTSFVDDRAVLPKDTCRSSTCATDIRMIVNSKLLVGDLTTAVRIIVSDDSVITPTSEVVTAQRLKHVMVALKSFRPSSAGGVDGLRPGHLKDLVAPQTAEARRRLLEDLANLCSKLQRGQLPKHARELLFASNLTALRKKDGCIRPIAVGNVFCRMATKTAQRVIPELRRQLPPVQLGVGVSCGCVAATHFPRLRPIPGCFWKQRARQIGHEKCVQYCET